MPKVTLKPRGACKKPNGRCLQNCGERKARETEGCGNDGLWTPRKTKGRFSSAPTALGNRKQRDSHIPTAAARRGKVENQKQVSHFPTCCLCCSTKSRKETQRRIASLPPPGSSFNWKMLSPFCHLERFSKCLHT